MEVTSSWSPLLLTEGADIIDGRNREREEDPKADRKFYSKELPAFYPFQLGEAK